jgi:hypothetical protein
MQSIVEIGFDFYHHLEEHEGEKWNNFFQQVLHEFESDPNVEVTNDKLIFHVGQNPVLFKDGTTFRRFSSMIPEDDDTILRYFETVYKIACTHFGSRIHRWEKNAEGIEDPFPIYSWPQVYQPVMRMHAKRRKSQEESSIMGLRE